MNKKTNLSAEAGQIVEDAQALLTATAHVADEKIVAARKRLAAAIEEGRDLLDDLEEKATAGAQAADEVIREHPYQAIGVALVVGALAGFFLRRRD